MLYVLAPVYSLHKICEYVCSCIINVDYVLFVCIFFRWIKKNLYDPKICMIFVMNNWIKIYMENVKRINNNSWLLCA